MQKTTNYKLNKPELGDFYEVEDFNYNVDVIDGKLKEHDDHSSDTSNPHNVTADQLVYSNAELSATNMKDAMDEIIENGINKIPDGVVYTKDDGEEVTPELILNDADTFGGHRPEYYAKADEVLPLDGSVPMSGRWLGLNNGMGTFSSNAEAITMNAYSEVGGNRRILAVYNDVAVPNVANAIELMTQDVASGAWKSYKLFGEHSKPTGSYTGNGDATKRTIALNGVGTAVLVYTSASPYRMAIVSNAGFIGKNGTTVIADSYVYGTGGQLTIQTTNALFNENGVTYHWRVL